MTRPSDAAKTVHYYITEGQEFRRVMPSGDVSYCDSMRAAVKDAIALHRKGYVVMFDDKPLFADTWLDRLLDRFAAWVASHKKDFRA